MFKTMQLVQKLSLVGVQIIHLLDEKNFVAALLAKIVFRWSQNSSSLGWEKLCSKLCNGATCKKCLRKRVFKTV